MPYSDFLKTIAVLGLELRRNPETLKKLVLTHDKKLIPVKEAMGVWETSTKDTPIMLAETGKSNIIAIDFDGPEGDKNFHLALELDPGCKYVAKGIGKGGGHLLYTNKNIDYLRQDISSPNGCKIGGLDLQMGRKLIFLATDQNKTKELLTPELTSYDELTDMPLSIQILVSNIYQRSQKRDHVESTGSNRDVHTDSKLYYVVKAALDVPDKYNHKLFNIITTREYKGIMEKAPKHPMYKYVPDNLPQDHSGNAYMVSIATILGRDPSIDVDTFTSTLHYINSLFSSPMPPHNVSDIATYITTGQSKINGTSVWQYNPEWQQTGMIYIDHEGSSHEVFTFVDKGTNHFLDHNHVTNRISILYSASALVDSIKMTSITRVNKEKIISKIQSVTLTSTPLHPIGIIRGDFGSEFNTYSRTEEQEIFMEPDTYKGYEYPETTIAFLENSMGKDRCHNFFLPFWKRKLHRREFSPLITVLYGPPHSGKSAVSEGILKPLTKGRNQQLSPETLTEKYDDWKLNKDIIFIDEIHNMRSDYRQKVVQVMNSISGVSTFTGIRAMQASASSEEHDNSISIMVACNKPVTLSTEVKDRRLVICRSRQTSSSALGLGNGEIHKRITEETKDFAYYLATEVQELSKEKYTDNGWMKDEDYTEFMDGALPFIKRFTAAIDAMNFQSFEELVMDFGISLEDIAHSCQVVKHQIHIRLYNSNEHEALAPSLIGNTNVEMKELLSELKGIGNTRVRTLDTSPGKRTINKKTVAIFHDDKVPEELLALINREKIEPI